MSTIRAVYTNVRAARTAIKDFARFEKIVAVLARHGLGHIVEAWDLQDRPLINLVLARRDPEQEKKSVYVRISEALQELGPTFIKLGQILSTRPDLIPQALCDEFSKLQDQVSPIPSRGRPRGGRGPRWAGPSTRSSPTSPTKPLACASIAQVHTARLKTGEDVVVKIQRPGIRDTVESDLNILHFVARKLEETIPEIKAFEPVAIAREFEKAIKRELDFNHEASHLDRFDRNFSSWTSVHIPRLYRTHCSDRVLVMERLVGVKITLAGEYGHDLTSVARECVRMLFKMVFEDGFFHGDLHPGNIFILEDGRIGLIDFGLVGRMSPTMKDAMADLLLSIVTHDYAGVARGLYDISLHTGKVNYGQWEADTVELCEKYFAHKTLAEVDFGALLRDLVEGAIRHDVRIPPDYTMFFKAIMTVEGIGKTITPDLDLIGECRPYVEQLIAQRYSPERVMKSAADALQAFARLGRTLPNKANEFLGHMENGRIAVSVENPRHDQLEDSRERRTNRAILAGLACTLLLVGTLVRHDARFVIFGAPGMTVISWATGSYLAFRLWWRITRNGRW